MLSALRGKFAACDPIIPSKNFGPDKIHISLTFDDIFYLSK